MVFEPADDGIVRTFRIVGVSPERNEGGAILKEVTIEAPIARMEGGTTVATLAMTLRRDAGAAGWRVVAFRTLRDAGASRQSPPS